jgi:hypothetical protein
MIVCYSKLLNQLQESSGSLKKALKNKKKVKEELHDLVRTLYLTLKIEELSLKNARAMLELINDRLRPTEENEMEL